MEERQREGGEGEEGNDWPTLLEISLATLCCVEFLNHVCIVFELPLYHAVKDLKEVGLLYKKNVYLLITVLFRRKALR